MFFVHHKILPAWAELGCGRQDSKASYADPRHYNRRGRSRLMPVAQNSFFTQTLENLRLPNDLRFFRHCFEVGAMRGFFFFARTLHTHGARAARNFLQRTRATFQIDS
jgi:hypothetical protein